MKLFFFLVFFFVIVLGLLILFFWRAWRRMCVCVFLSNIYTKCIFLGDTRNHCLFFVDIFIFFLNTNQNNTFVFPPHPVFTVEIYLAIFFLFFFVIFYLLIFFCFVLLPFLPILTLEHSRGVCPVS